MKNPYEQDPVQAKDIKAKMKLWLYNSIILYFSYCIVTLIQTLFFGSGVPLHIAIIPSLGGFPIVLSVIFVYIRLPYSKTAPVIIAIVSQVGFFIGSANMRRLDFYFIMMLLILCITMNLKRFKPLAVTAALMVLINIAAIIFLIPHWEWLNLYQFYGQFLLFLFGSVLISIITYNVEQKDNSAERARTAFSSLLDTTPNLLVITDTLNRVRYVSEPMAQFAYYSSQELAIGRPLLDLFRDKKLKLMFADILDADGFIETVMNINIDGEERHFKVVADKLEGGGQFIDISDITSTVNSRVAAEDAQMRAEAANASKSRFLATMSHEIRTPLNAIIGIAQIGLQHENLSEKYAAILEKIHNSGAGLLGIINDILDLSKIETGKLELNPQEYYLPSLINDTAQINMVRTVSKQIKFIIDADKDLPSRLHGDELRIKQILNNLLSNAIKYTDKGHVKLSVSHSAESFDSCESLNSCDYILLHFSVEDTGQGMKIEDQQKLFSEYLRFNVDVNYSTEGTGIGLSIVKNLVEMMGGKIEVQSEYGKGSTFSVTIKQKAVKSGAIGEEISGMLLDFTFPGERQNLKKNFTIELMPYGKVLVVDDVETNLFVAEGLLSPYKLTIETANSGFEVLDLIKNGKTYDVIFMDYMMPEMDGIETTHKLRALGYKGIIVALTADALVGNAEMFRESGFDDFISKPIDVQHLDVVLHKFVRDKYPLEARKYREQDSEDLTAKTSEINPKLLEVFRRDAEKAVKSLRETLASGDIKLYITTVHAMKSALANIGKNENSKMAAELEDAGLNGNEDFINANTNVFIESLEALIKDLNKDKIIEDDISLQEDIPFLHEQLKLIKTACENYDDTAVYAALNLLKEKQWRNATSAALEKIHSMLFLHSDFDAVAEQALAEINKTNH